MKACESTTASVMKKPSESTALAVATSIVQTWPPAGSVHVADTFPPVCVTDLKDGGAASAGGAATSSATRATRRMRPIETIIGSRVRLLEYARRHDAREAQRRHRPFGWRHERRAARARLPAAAAAEPAVAARRLDLRYVGGRALGDAGGARPARRAGAVP